MKAIYTPNYVEQKVQKNLTNLLSPLLEKWPFLKERLNLEWPFLISSEKGLFPITS